MSQNLGQAKAKVSQSLLEQKARGINGVAINPLKQKLLVFFTDREAAENFLREEFGSEFLLSVELLSGEPALPDEEEPSGSPALFKLLGRLKAILAGVPLKPASRIKESTSMGWDGRVGCFVSLNDPNNPIAVLTAEHIFYTRSASQSNNVDVELDELPWPAGKTWRFANLLPGPGPGNLADCALFLPDLKSVSLKKTNPMVRTHVTAGSIQNTETKEVINLSRENRTGIVLDTDATVCPVGNTPGKISLVRQILVEGQGFGRDGHSGSLVVMAQDDAALGFTRGQALGLYIYVCTGATHHFVTPLHACFGVFTDITGIHIP